MSENTPEIVKALKAASQALRSYQYGNSAPDLAQSIADKCDAALRLVGETPDPPSRDQQDVKKLRHALGVLLDQVDYTRGVGAPNEPVGGLLSVDVLTIARRALEETRP